MAKKINGSVNLSVGDRISIGHSQFIIPQNSSSSLFRLIGVGGPIQGNQWNLEDGKSSVNIGRGRNVHIRIQDKAASRVHTNLEVLDGRWMISDCGSSNGTLA